MWQGLDEFLHVVEHGSFTHAAKAMEVSTSHISRQVQQLENRLGSVLFQRTTRKISLTDAGREYAVKLKAIKQELIDANNQLQGEQRRPKGLIRITGAGEFVATNVAPKIVEFVKRYPDVEVDMDFNNRNVDLVEEGFDLAIRFGRMQDSNLIARPLCPRIMTLVASPDYLQQNPAPTTPHQLTKHNCLVAMGKRWRFNFNGEIKEVKITGNWRSNHPRALLSATLGGLGIAHLACDIVEQYVQQGQLVTLLDEFQVTDNASWLVYPRKDLMPYRVRLLIEYLLTSFRAC
ncbi:transcriptional regulator [Pseudoalteromonas porphyrae]|uniref:Transcriptional regulator n=2 Tax=Pseudoalteromonas TaxID=53246 RepID=A0A0N1EKH2_9GAMM|nr:MULTISPECIES: LysR family transcriptional regulator [Pseudoalteromonas]KPH62940.1 transcriptional regulator [Pseudoalteromonas porphyrae]KPH94462.1 transcriptional regulator [Pseudoalteromonas porphyrae]NMR24583.1 LysR family transcriptional regulator [Pseudoalteromonas sp. NEC-BIFX-2020_015]NNG42632.1 LysR family transcriptional regulator [Pseudoalteromonas sp. NEC-BIFX-2020_002]